MALSPRERPGSIAFRGLEQFHLRGDGNGVGYCIAGAKPNALEFSNASDVICLLRATSTAAPSSRTIARSRWCFSATSPLFTRVSAMCGCAPATCVTASLLSATGAIFRACSTIATSNTCGAAAAATTFATTRSGFLRAMSGSACAGREGLQALELQFLALGTYVETMRRLAAARAGAAGRAVRSGIRQALRLYRWQSRGEAFVRGPLPRRQSAAAHRLREREGPHRTLLYNS